MRRFFNLHSVRCSNGVNLREKLINQLVIGKDVSGKTKHFFFREIFCQTVVGYSYQFTRIYSQHAKYTRSRVIKSSKIKGK